MCFGGYMYSKGHEGVNEITWRCVKRKLMKCVGTVKTSLDESNAREMLNHCHPPNENEVRINVAKQEMKTKAQTTHDKPNQVSC